MIDLLPQNLVTLWDSELRRGDPNEPAAGQGDRKLADRHDNTQRGQKVKLPSFILFSLWKGSKSNILFLFQYF